MISPHPTAISITARTLRRFAQSLVHVHAHQKTAAANSEIGFKEMNRLRERVLGRCRPRRKFARRFFPFLVKHIVTERGWNIRNRFGKRYKR